MSNTGPWYVHRVSGTGRRRAGGEGLAATDAAGRVVLGAAAPGKGGAPGLRRTASSYKRSKTDPRGRRLRLARPRGGVAVDPAEAEVPHTVDASERRRPRGFPSSAQSSPVPACPRRTSSAPAPRRAVLKACSWSKAAQPSPFRAMLQSPPWRSGQQRPALGMEKPASQPWPGNAHTRPLQYGAPRTTFKILRQASTTAVISTRGYDVTCPSIAPLDESSANTQAPSP